MQIAIVVKNKEPTKISHRNKLKRLAKLHLYNNRHDYMQNREIHNFTNNSSHKKINALVR